MPPSCVRTDLPTRARYSQGAGIYRIIPRVVARPVDVEQLHQALDFAKRVGLAVIPRGAGSAMGGGNVGDGLLLDLSGYEPDRCEVTEDRIAYVSPAVTLAQVNAAAAPLGLRLPPDPSSGAWATVGGMISTNAAGGRSMRYGSIRRWVRGVAMQTADGYLDLDRDVMLDPKRPLMVRWQRDVAPLMIRHTDQIRARFPAVTKNSAGYALDHYLDSGDLLDLIIGGEGTLGVITDATLRLDRIPVHRGALRVALRDRADVVPAMEAIRTQGPSTLEFLDASFLRLIAGQVVLRDAPALLCDAAGLLLADIEGDDFDDMWERGAAALAAVKPFAIDSRLATDPAEIAQLWRVRHGASPVLAGITDGRRSLQLIEDGCVPPARLAEYLDAVDAACAAARVDAVIFGHAGDGHVHVNLLPNLRDADWRDRVRAIYTDVSSAVIRLGGTPSGEHGAGRLRAGLLEALYGPEVIACFRAVKRCFDPGGHFNPGVILGDTDDPLTRLKFGAHATPLPDGIDEYLRDIETNARWGESRWM